MTREGRAYVTAGILVLSVVLCGLFYYKWGGAVRTLGGVHATGGWTASAQGLTTGGVLSASVYYFRQIWIALVYGLIIGAAVRTFVSPRRLVSLLAAGGPVRAHLAGAAAGAPLMLCSCCIAPVFSSVYERGSRLGPALALMLASPGLNPAALVLTFLLFPAALAAGRLSAALAAVLLLPVLLERLFGSSVVPPPDWQGATSEDDTLRSASDLLARFVRSLARLTVTTVPLIVVGVILSSLAVPVSVKLTWGGGMLAVVLVAVIAVLIALPTFFEIPLAMLLLNVGAPGAAAAMLVAGPIVNLPSLLVLARETNAKLPLALAAGIWLLAVGAGVAGLAGAKGS